MPNFSSIYLELQELWKRLTKAQQDITAGTNPVGAAGGVLTGSYPDPEALQTQNGKINVHIEPTTYTNYQNNDATGSVVQFVRKDTDDDTVRGVVLKSWDVENSSDPLSDEAGSIFVHGGNNVVDGGRGGKPMIVGGFGDFGGSVQILGGIGTGSSGGDINIAAGCGNSNGGNVIIKAGSGSSGLGGGVSVKSDNGESHNSYINMSGISSNHLTGSIVTIRGGYAETGGDIDIRAGNGVNNGGDVFITSGDGVNDGDINLLSRNGIINFNGDTNFSRKNTWTLNLKGETTAGSVTFISGYRNAYYTLVGNVCFVTCYFKTDANPSTIPTGSMYIDGLPHNVGSYPSALNVSVFDELNNNTIRLFAEAAASTDKISLWVETSGSTPTKQNTRLQGSDINWASPFYLTISGFYFI